MHIVLVDHDVAGAVHRLEVVVDLFDRHRRVHVLVVRLEVPRRLVDLLGRDVRRVDEVIAALELLLLLELLDLVPNHGALWLPEDQSGADLLIHGEEVQLLAQPAVVTLGGLFQLLQVVVQLFLRVPGRAVDALEHRAVLVAAPVRAGHRLELERADLLRVLDVRATA